MFLPSFPEHELFKLEYQIVVMFSNPGGNRIDVADLFCGLKVSQAVVMPGRACLHGAGALISCCGRGPGERLRQLLRAIRQKVVAGELA